MNEIGPRGVRIPSAPPLRSDNERGTRRIITLPIPVNTGP